MRAAHVYAERFGWKVVPLHSVGTDGACSCEKGAACRSAGKHPRLGDWVSKASKDAAVIAEWWRSRADSNVGLATGSASGFFALDVDPRNGGDTSLAALLNEHGPLPVTPEQATPSGGAHYLFKMPARPVSNAAIGLGLDIRGDGGQIVAAPSRTVGQYRWVRAPWDTPLAEAPAWLLGMLGRGAVRGQIQSKNLTDARGYFPAASPAVLDEARRALELHGPAVDGEAGGKHAIHAGAILTHDFALTEDEAWPLFLVWNQTCVPPWRPDELGDLRERLRRGDKYGKLEYGNRRPLDTVEAARRLIQQWQDAGSSEASILTMVAAVRPLAKICGDPVRHAIIERELRTATGLPSRNLALPKPAAPVAAARQGEIKVTTELHRVADESLAAIAPHVFARNGELVQVVKAERTFIHTLEPAGIVDLMSKSAIYVRHDETKGTTTQAAPVPVATILHARRDHPRVRVLEAVTTAPVFLADGSILQERGYNAQARVFLEPNVRVDVPTRPDLNDAQRAVALFWDLLSDFRFASDADKAAWLCAVISPLVKAATSNAPAPLICISASTPGAGKTLLADIAARIVTGAGAEVRPYNPKDVAEWQKRLTAFVRAGSPVNVFDNVNGPFGDESIDRLVTSSTWADRQLGASDAPPLPVVSTWLATGNNIEPVGDTVRRVLMVRLEVREERPQERTGFRRPLLDQYAQEHRAELLGAALTILRAFHVAGRPSQSLPAWGSFTAWSEIVRGALVWAGCADPFDTQRRCAAEVGEAENDTHDWWISVVRESDGTPAGIVTLANARNAQDELSLREALTPKRLRVFLSRFVDRPRAGRRIRRERDAGRGVTIYRVEQL